jgi:hypothetical protein
MSLYKKATNTWEISHLLRAKDTQHTKESNGSIRKNYIIGLCCWKNVGTFVINIKHIEMCCEKCSFLGILFENICVIFFKLLIKNFQCRY